jgi:hypothetical protein
MADTHVPVHPDLAYQGQQVVLKGVGLRRHRRQRKNESSNEAEAFPFHGVDYRNIWIDAGSTVRNSRLESFCREAWL